MVQNVKYVVENEVTDHLKALDFPPGLGIGSYIIHSQTYHPGLKWDHHS